MPKNTFKYQPWPGFGRFCQGLCSRTPNNSRRCNYAIRPRTQAANARR